MKILFTFFLLFFFTYLTIAQVHITCGTDESARIINNNYPHSEILRRQLENQYRQVIANEPSSVSSNGAKYVIPVVVHVIHDPAHPIGTLSNITDAKVYEQIEILNEAFRGKIGGNTNEPDAQIEFRLVSKDPYGNCHSGINRLGKAEANNVKISDNTTATSIKRFIHWPREKYLNLYVVSNIVGFLGFATFPWQVGSSALDSLDGVVIDYKYFGRTAHPKYHLGRTAVHEIGHWLGLYHTFQPELFFDWAGDTIYCKNDTCLANGDKVCDTPPVNKPNFTSHLACSDTSLNSCLSDEDDSTALNPFRSKAKGGLGGQPDMVQNHMDYSDDFCLNLFTPGQVKRMVFYLEGSRSTVWSNANLTLNGTKGLLHDFDSLRTGLALNGAVKAMVEWNGKLVVAGDFTAVDGIAVNGIATWDGLKWEKMTNVPSQMTGQIYAMANYRGDLYVGGTFDVPGQCKHLAKHGGNFWSKVTTAKSSPNIVNATSHRIHTLIVYNSKLYAGGDFGQVDGDSINANRVACWDGSVWAPLSTGLTGNTAACYAFTLWNNHLVVGGRFTAAGGILSDKVALWDGSSWSSLNKGTNVVSQGSLNSLAAYEGKLFTGGDYASVGGTLTSGLTAFNGTTWSNTDANYGLNRLTLEPYNGLLWVGGDLTDLGTPASHIYTYDIALDSMMLVSKFYNGFDGRARCMTVYKNQLYIGGDFDILEGANGTPNKNVHFICSVKKYCEGSVGAGIDKTIIPEKFLKLYPNPVSNKLLIENAEKEIEVFNLLGQKLMMKPVIDNKMEIDVNALPAGIYFLRSNKEVLKFIKE